VPRLLCVVLAIWPAAALAGPPGRVIRVERAGGVHVAPRLCDLRGDGGTCLGDEPRVGQIVSMLDEQRVVADLQIIEVTSFITGCANLWSVKTRIIHERGRGRAIDDGIGVIDPNLVANRAHLLEASHLPTAPSGLSGEEVWRAIDRDGDGAADLMVTRYPCDGASRPIAGATTYCINVWARIAGKMTRTTQINRAHCNL
jgi:hypothetical protein